jgi:hypothetical protein
VESNIGLIKKLEEVCMMTKSKYLLATEAQVEALIESLLDSLSDAYASTQHESLLSIVYFFQSY